MTIEKPAGFCDSHAKAWGAALAFILIKLACQSCQRYERRPVAIRRMPS
jgi:hypothetical protein